MMKEQQCLEEYQVMPVYLQHANDLMKLMELYRRMGEYGGEQIIGRDVLKEYTRVQFPENNNRRGLGFDKPLLNNSEVPQKEAYPAKSASPESFGHSGYTGTFVWVDPVYEITMFSFATGFILHGK